MKKVEIFYEVNKKLDFDVDDFIDYALNKLNIENVEFNVIFVNNKKIKELNNTYRNINNETDVITFALEDYDKSLYEERRILGDIYISLEKAEEQAKEYDHSLKREVLFLIIHGLLHLLGYDHMKKEDEIKMFKVQEEILNEYGIKR